MPIILRALLYAMFHPFNGYFLARFQGLPVSVVGKVLLIAQSTDAVIIITALTVAERILRGKSQ